MVLDFAALPPEINSGLMYAGAGAGPLMAAATAWNNLAAELSSTATQWESIITALTTEQWTGAGSAAAAAAAQPVVSWFTTSAAAAEQAGAQATASAAAYETAFAATVPPPVIAANRAQLAALVATNFLGINTPAIMATEAQYAEMWVQDATTMYTYQATSTAAGVLQPVTPMTPATNPAGEGLQAASVAQAETATPVQALSNALPSLAPAAVDPNSLIGSIDGLIGTPFIFNGVNGFVNTAAWFTMNAIPTAVSFGHTTGSIGSVAWPLADAVAPAPGFAAITPGTMVGSVSGAAASASLGEASAVGGLSVPAGWSAATPAGLASSTAPLAGSGWTAAAEEAAPVTAMPGMPGAAAAAAKGSGAFSAPRYGFKPVVMPKQVVV
ncbi:MAG TPA: PPE family protein [Mycobacterium sp.]|nr:PPE family protein [Mycobacterium sp.]